MTVNRLLTSWQQTIPSIHGKCWRQSIFIIFLKWTINNLVNNNYVIYVVCTVCVLIYEFNKQFAKIRHFSYFYIVLGFSKSKSTKNKNYYCKRSWIFPYRLRKLKTVWHVFPCANLNKLIVSRHCLISELIRQFCMKIIHKISMTCVKRMSTRGKRLVSPQNRLVLIISHIHHV